MAKKSTAKAKAKKTTTKRKKTTSNSEQMFMVEILAVIVFAISIFMLLSLFGIGAGIGTALKNFQLGLFGILGYIFSIVFLLAYLFFIANKDNLIIKIKVLLATFVYILLVAFIHLFSSEDFRGLSSAIEAYNKASFGGFIGSIISGYLSLFMGKVGTAILIIAIIFLIYLYIAGLSFLDFLKNISNLFYVRAKEDIGKIATVIKERRLRQEDEYDEYYDNYDDNYDEDYDEYQENETYYEGEEYIAKRPKKILRGINTGYSFEDVEERIEKHSKNLSSKNKTSKEDIKRAEKTEDSLEKQENIQKTEEENINILYKDSKFDFSTPIENNIENKEDIFEGIINNSNKEESLDEKIIEKVSDILSRKREINENDDIYMDIDKESTEDIKQINTIEVLEEQETKNSYDESLYLEESKPIYEDIKELEDEELEDEESEIGREHIEVKKDNLSNDNASLTRGERKVVTASGKVIEVDSEALQKKVEIARAEKYENSLIKKVNKEESKKTYIFPPSSLLKLPEIKKVISDEEYKQTAIKLQQTLHNFGVSVRVTNISCGPVVTRYELSPEQGVKVSKIVSLQDDIKLSLAANDIRIEAPIPGKSAVGIEVPNKENNIVYFRELIESKEFREDKYKLGFAVGKDISGQVVVTDIAKMPHLLIAGATGSGKSVCINTLIMSILYKYKPDEVKLIMIDPKVVELSIYNGIPHLLIPVVTEPKKAASAINWAVAEMTDRYKKFAQAGVRDLKGYNDKIEKEKLREDAQVGEKLSQIVIIIDELADLMMVAQNEVEEAICRLAQLARACGIHLVIATQRPSVNVITGLIKANIPSRIAFAVTSGVDSRTILDSVGADKLLGKGDMLFSPQGSPKPMRVQGAFISDNEVFDVVDFIKNQAYSETYDMNTLEKIENSSSFENKTSNGDVDELFLQAGRFIIDKEKASIGNLQRVFKIGFNRAARIMDQLYEAGVVGSEQGTKPREILMDMETFEEMYGSN